MMGRVDEVPQEMPRRALVVGTGGTIAMLGRSQYDWVEYGEGGNVRPITEVLRELQPLLTDVEVEIVSSRTLASTGIDWKDWVELACLIRAVTAKRRDVRGVVLTHGTASLEDTAWFLELVCETALPIVLVGAQRPPNTVGSDAAPNLRAALAVAMAGPCRGLGVLVVMNNQVFAARDVRKASNFSLEAFESRVRPARTRRRRRNSGDSTTADPPPAPGSRAAGPCAGGAAGHARRHSAFLPWGRRYCDSRFSAGGRESDRQRGHASRALHAR